MCVQLIYLSLVYGLDIVVLVVCGCVYTKWMIPAAVNHTEMKMETSWARRMELDVLRMLRYCRISGTVISLRARRKRRPKNRTHAKVAGHVTGVNAKQEATYRSRSGPDRWTQRTAVS